MVHGRAIAPVEHLAPVSVSLVDQANLGEPYTDGTFRCLEVPGELIGCLEAAGVCALQQRTGHQGAPGEEVRRLFSLLLRRARLRAAVEPLGAAVIDDVLVLV